MLSNTDFGAILEAYPLHGKHICVGSLYAEAETYYVTVDYGEPIFTSSNIDDCYEFISCEWGFNV